MALEIVLMSCMTAGYLVCHEYAIRNMFCFLNSAFFFFNDTATTEIYTLSLHDALPICVQRRRLRRGAHGAAAPPPGGGPKARDRKSTRLNSSHGYISYAVFCLKKKKITTLKSMITP